MACRAFALFTTIKLSYSNHRALIGKSTAWEHVRETTYTLLFAIQISLHEDTTG